MKKNIKFLILAFSLAISSTIATAQNNAISDAKNSGDNYFEIAKNLDIFTTLYKELNTFYVDETNPGDLMKKGIDEMLKSLDPFTNYIPESEIEDFRFLMYNTQT